MKFQLEAVLLVSTCYAIGAADARFTCEPAFLSRWFFSGRTLNCAYRCAWSIRNYAAENDGTPCIISFYRDGVCYKGYCVHNLPHPQPPKPAKEHPTTTANTAVTGAPKNSGEKSGTASQDITSTHVPNVSQRTEHPSNEKHAITTKASRQKLTTPRASTTENLSKTSHKSTSTQTTRKYSGLPLTTEEATSLDNSKGDTTTTYPKGDDSEKETTTTYRFWPRRSTTVMAKEVITKRVYDAEVTTSWSGAETTTNESTTHPVPTNENFPKTTGYGAFSVTTQEATSVNDHEKENATASNAWPSPPTAVKAKEGTTKGEYNSNVTATSGEAVTTTDESTTPPVPTTENLPKFSDQSTGTLFTTQKVSPVGDRERDATTTSSQDYRDFEF